MSDVMVEKRFPLSIAAFVLVLLLLVSGAGIMMFLSRLASLNAESRTFAENAVSGIAADWNDKQFVADFSPTARTKLKTADLQGVVDLRANLGRFNTALGATGGVDDPYISLFFGPLKATYSDRGIFTDGIVTFHLGLIKRNGRWMIDFYHLDVQDFGRPTANHL